MSPKIAALRLLLVSAIWGSSFPIVSLVAESVDPFLFVAVRFSLAALFALPYFFRHINKEILIVGSVLGMIQLGIYITQMIGLETVHPSRAAFLTGIYVFLVPFISPLFKMGRPSSHDLLSALICCIGIFVLMECNIGQMSAGDVWVIGCAALIALSIVYIGRNAKSTMDPLMLAYSQIIMTAVFSWIPVFFFAKLDFSPFFTLPLAYSLGFCSFLANLFAIVWQAKSLRYVSLQNAALIFSLEPVFASLLSSILGSTLPSMYTLAGGSIILFSIAYLELLRPKSQNYVGKEAVQLT